MDRITADHISEEDKDRDTFCSICTDVFSDPVQTSCGHRFCSSCIEKWRRTSRACPSCRTTLKEGSWFLDGAFKREIQNRIVKCPNNNCDATFPIKDIDDHLEECLMEKWKCTNECGHSVLRAKKDFHLARCSHRLVECQFCSKQVNLHKRGAHHEECPQKPLLCTNKCGKRILRSAMEEHCRDDCPKQLVDCAYCGKSIARKFLVDHMAETKPHIEFLVNTTKQLEVRLLEMEKKMTKQLEVRLLEMEKKMTKEFKSFEHQLVETQKKMTKNLEDRLLEAKEETLSEENSFIWFLRYTSRNAAYTSPEFCVKGYRFTVSLQASNNNTNMGVYFTLQKGSNDDVLPWPFRAKIWFQILNPTENRGHKKSLVMNTALADEKSIAESWQQPGHYGRGYPCFILKTDIPKYLKNSVLTIQTHVRLCEEWRFSGKVAGQ